MKNKILVLVVFALLAVGLSPLFSQEGELTKTDEFYMPVGDPEAGRLSFVSLNCNSCHRVAGDPILSKPEDGWLGPALGVEHSFHTVGELADSIVSPTHKISPKAKPISGTSKIARMPDYKEIMTMRQLVDIVAYLESFE